MVPIRSFFSLLDVWLSQPELCRNHPSLHSTLKATKHNCSGEVLLGELLSPGISVLHLLPSYQPFHTTIPFSSVVSYYWAEYHRSIKSQMSNCCIFWITGFLPAGSPSWSSSMTSTKPTCRRKSTSTGRRGSQTPGCTAAFTSSPRQATGEIPLRVGCTASRPSSFQRGCFHSCRGEAKPELVWGGSHARGRFGDRLAAPSEELKQRLPVNPHPAAICFLNSNQISIISQSLFLFPSGKIVWLSPCVLVALPRPRIENGPSCTPQPSAAAWRLQPLQLHLSAHQ